VLSQLDLPIILSDLTDAKTVFSLLPSTNHTTAQLGEIRLIDYGKLYDEKNGDIISLAEA